MAQSRAALTVLILGGYGVFGGRLARLLAEEDLALVISGRSLAAARDFCGQLHSKARLSPLQIDRNGDILAALEAVKPDLIVDASGPFQAYGDDPYRVVKAALALGSSYLDLADGADFVGGVEAFDAQARARGVFVIAGASTCPALTCAALRHLARGMARLDEVEAGIAPSPLADVGPNVLRAIASYAGRPVALRRDARPASAYAALETRRRTIAPPGVLPLRSTLFSLVEVPDLAIMPRLWPGLRGVWFGMGPSPAWLHRLFIGLAFLVRLKLLPGLGPLAPLLHRAHALLRHGEHRGGMFVRAAGLDAAGEPVERSWHLVAEGDDGPFIPAMAAAAIIRGCLAGRRPQAGARSAAGELQLADYAPLFAPRRIRTGCREEGPRERERPLYRRLLGASFDALPAPLQAMHDIGSGLAATGVASVEGGANLAARLVGAALGLPRPGRDIPLSVRFEPKGGGEIWHRSFANRSFSSRQSEGRGRADKLLREHFGALSFALALVVEDKRLNLVMRGWRLFGIAMPRWLAPRCEAYESAESGRFNFHVEIGLPLIGRLVSYRGWLVPRP